MELTKSKLIKTEIGKIPEDWKVVPVIQLAKIITGGRDTQDRVADGKYPFYVRSNVVERINSYSFEGEAILTSGDGVGVGKIYHYLNCKFDYHQRVYNIHDFKGIDGKFFYYYFSNHFYERVMTMTAKSSVDSVRREMIADMKIPVPPTLEEQKAIAIALSDVDELILNLEKLISKKKAIKQGTMQQLLTQPNKGGKRLPGFKGEWEVKSLVQLASITMGQSPLSENYNNEYVGLPLIQGNADIENRKTIVRMYTSQITKRASKNDIIMTVRAPVGEIAIAEFDCCIGRGVCSIRYKNDFLYHHLIFIEKLWGKLSSGSTFDSINSNQLKEVKVAIPSDEKEQLAISQVLSDIDSEILFLESKKLKFQNIKQGMMQELLTGKTRLI